jgi:O-antigen/teichoic acid export membrane protein
MLGFKQAFLWASAGRYSVTLISIAMTVIMARLISPSEYGLAVLGTTVLFIADAIRSLAGASYLIQVKELNSDKIRTSCTISLIVTLAMTFTLLILAPWLASYYANPMLERYFHVIAISYLIGPFSYQIAALMTRDMAFARLAFISVVTALVNGITAIALASLGFSALSYAWASVGAAAAAVLLSFYFYPNWSIFRPLLREWRSVLGFGVFDGATTVLNRLTENLFYLIIGRLLNVEAVGLCQRAFLLAGFPERVFLAGFGAVALPAFSEKVRQGHDLKHSYLRAVEYITAIQWPALMLVVFLAHPIVEIVLGQQWLAVVPLLQIFAGALMLNFPVSLEYPTLVAAGAIRYLPAIVMGQATVITLLRWLGTATYGLYGGAVSMLVIVPVNLAISLLVVRSRVPFSCRELAGAMRRSALLLGLSAVGPMILLLLSGWSAKVSIPTALFAAILSGIGWTYGLRLTRHPLAQDVFGACDALGRSAVDIRAMAACVWLFGDSRQDGPEAGSDGLAASRDRQHDCTRERLPSGDAPVAISPRNVHGNR